MVARLAVLVCALTTAHGFIAHHAVVPRSAMARPVVMKIRDDTARAAQAAAEREAEEARLAAEAAADPEPGPCIECGDEATYWDGMVTFACTRCGHEWGIEEAKAAAEENITRDVNGTELNNNDQVVLIKDLAGGKLKKGLKVKIRLGDFGDGHDLEATIPSQGTYALKSQFVKKGSQ